MTRLLRETPQRSRTRDFIGKTRARGLGADPRILSSPARRRRLGNAGAPEHVAAAGGREENPELADLLIVVVILRGPPVVASTSGGCLSWGGRLRRLLLPTRWGRRQTPEGPASGSPPIITMFLTPRRHVAIEAFAAIVVAFTTVLEKVAVLAASPP